MGGQGDGNAAAVQSHGLTIAGPGGSLYLLGCELEEVYSVVPIAQGDALAIGMVGYRQELFCGRYSNPDALPGVRGSQR